MAHHDAAGVNGSIRTKLRIAPIECAMPDRRLKCSVFRLPTDLTETSSWMSGRGRSEQVHKLKLLPLQNARRESIEICF